MSNAREFLAALRRTGERSLKDLEHLHHGNVRSGVAQAMLDFPDERVRRDGCAVLAMAFANRCLSSMADQPRNEDKTDGRNAAVQTEEESMTKQEMKALRLAIRSFPKDPDLSLFASRATLHFMASLTRMSQRPAKRDMSGSAPEWTTFDVEVVPAVQQGYKTIILGAMRDAVTMMESHPQNAEIHIHCLKALRLSVLAEIDVSGVARLLEVTVLALRMTCQSARSQQEVVDCAAQVLLTLVNQSSQFIIDLAPQIPMMLEAIGSEESSEVTATWSITVLSELQDRNFVVKMALAQSPDAPERVVNCLARFPGVPTVVIRCCRVLTAMAEIKDSNARYRIAQQARGASAIILGLERSFLSGHGSNRPVAVEACRALCAIRQSVSGDEIAGAREDYGNTMADLAEQYSTDVEILKDVFCFIRFLVAKDPNLRGFFSNSRPILAHVLNTIRLVSSMNCLSSLTIVLCWGEEKVNRISPYTHWSRHICTYSLHPS